MKAFVSVVKKILGVIGQYHLLSKKDRVLIAVSGGTDSMALLHVLLELREIFELELAVAHLNHHLREHASLDLEFVRREAEMLKLPFYGGSEDVKLISKNEGLSPEEAARKVRYEFLKKAASSFGAQKIAVAHTQNDQAETLLLRMVKGTGGEGLRGMRFSRPLDSYILIRPLLDISKKELKNFLQKKNISWREDESNQEMAFLRNKIRHSLMPFLEKEFNPVMVESLCRLASILDEENEFLNRALEKVFLKCKKNESGLSLDLKFFLSLEMALQRRLIRKLFWQFSLGKDLSYTLVEEILSFLKNAQSGKKWDLLEDVELRIEFDRFWIGPIHCKQTFSFEKIRVPGEISWEMGTWSFKMVAQLSSQLHNQEKKNFPEIYKNLSERKPIELVEYFDAAQVGPEIQIRSFEPGDVYDPIGLHGFKKLKKIFIDEKIPLRDRLQIPLFLSRGKIFWLTGYRISESFKVGSNQNAILKISLEIKKGC
ncbi:MAG: tRNA lysidine(34) synthetase TilS [Chlamydiae bacterium]|nr:tRNA lysidine(34) synthetase TilS [Chlamydiota bacterium]MBI3266348.1 tRNA lysidine(34) synthetase TilS [Chlamydiota bacterium]